MSSENIALFYEKVEQDDRLQEQVASMIKEEQSKLNEQVVNIASENGFTFSNEDVQQFIKQSLHSHRADGELDDGELEHVAGGSAFIGLAIGFFGVTFVSAVGTLIYKIIDDNT